MTSTPIAAVILAGGDGGRIGTPKLKLRIGGQTYLEHIAKTLGAAGISPIASVVHERFRAWASVAVPGISIAAIEDPEASMFESVRAGLLRLGQDHATLIVPVDHPYVTEETYRRLVQTARANPDAIVKPVFNGISGHPIVVPAEVVRLVVASAGGKTLRDVIASSGVRQAMIDVEDEGVLRNMNTPNDLEGDFAA